MHAQKRAFVEAAAHQPAVAVLRPQLNSLRAKSATPKGLVQRSALHTTWVGHIGALRNLQMNSDSEEEAAGVLPEAIGEAASEGDLETVKAWLDGGGALASRSVNDLDVDGWSLLLWASGGYDEILTEEHVELARYLVSRGARLDVASRFSGSTALHYACSSGGASPEYVSVLVAAGAQVNAEDEDGMRPLGRVALDTVPNEMHHVEIVKILLRSGATLDFALGDESFDDALRDCRSRHPVRYGEHTTAIEEIVASVRRHGSWKAHCRAQHRQILRIRSLVARGRVKLDRPRRWRPRGRDARQEGALNFLVRQGDNGIVWTILSYWRETG